MLRVRAEKQRIVKEDGRGLYEAGQSPSNSIDFPFQGPLAHWDPRIHHQISLSALSLQTAHTTAK